MSGSEDEQASERARAEGRASARRVRGEKPLRWDSSLRLMQRWDSLVLFRGLSFGRELEEFDSMLHAGSQGREPKRSANVMPGGGLQLAPQNWWWARGRSRGAQCLLGIVSAPVGDA
jgi:hypothetical protein